MWHLMPMVSGISLLGLSVLGAPLETASLMHPPIPLVVLRVKPCLRLLTSLAYMATLLLKCFASMTRPCVTDQGLSPSEAVRLQMLLRAAAPSTFPKDRSWVGGFSTLFQRVFSVLFSLPPNVHRMFTKFFLPDGFGSSGLLSRRGRGRHRSAAKTEGRGAGEGPEPPRQVVAADLGRGLRREHGHWDENERAGPNGARLLAEQEATKTDRSGVGRSVRGRRNEAA